VSPSRDEIKRDVKKIESKKDFRKRIHRSPDDGDGCALACAPDRIFATPEPAPAVGGHRPMAQAIARLR
jgi:hypothetical protein